MAPLSSTWSRLALLSPLLFSLTSASLICRCFPGDTCWPSTAEWNSFNQTVGGTLIATIPLAAVCHNDSFTTYNAAACDALKAAWFAPETHIASSSSPMAQLFTNNSCNPFLPVDAPCTLGNFVSFAVSATTVAHYQSTLAFAQKHNIRLVVRNTGHDYNGRSVGAGALAIWTNHIKTMQVKDYSGKSYKGKAIKMGAGVQVAEAYKFADSQGLVTVGGNCPTVGVAGGYSQGGGHGPLASKYGLGVDQVLEWEVVLANGKLVTASSSTNPDLYWALNGGGGGTYGVVYSMTVKAYPSISVGTANLTVPFTPQTPDLFWDVVSTFHKNLPALVASGTTLIWTITNDYFAIAPATAPGVTASTLDTLLAPTLNKLKSSQIPYQYTSANFKTWWEAYVAVSPPEPVAYYQLGSRLIPKSVVKSDSTNAQLTAAIQTTLKNNGNFVGVGYDVTKYDPTLVSANPAWRDSIISAAVGILYDYSDYQFNVQASLDITQKLLPPYAALSPGGGAYLNEGDWRQPNFQQVFYGANYVKLLAIKIKYDPTSVFYALTGVGSEAWTQQASGRLCTTL